MDTHSADIHTLFEELQEGEIIEESYKTVLRETNLVETQKLVSLWYKDEVKRCKSYFI